MYFLINLFEILIVEILFSNNLKLKYYNRVWGKNEKVDLFFVKYFMKYDSAIIRRLNVLSVEDCNLYFEAIKATKYKNEEFISHI